MRVSCFVCVVSLFYLSIYSKPPTPPTASASVPKTDFMVGFKELLVHKRAWVLFLAMGIPNGVFSGWVRAYHTTDDRLLMHDTHFDTTMTKCN